MSVSRVLGALIGFNGAAQPQGAQASCPVATPWEYQSFSSSEGTLGPPTAHPFVIHSDAQACIF